MFINKQQFDERCKEHSNLMLRMKTAPISPAQEIPFDKTQFKLDGVPKEKADLSEGKRAMVAATALLTSPSEAAEIFDISESHARQLAEGDYSRSTDQETREIANQRLREEIYQALGEVREVAKGKMMLALGLITKESLDAISDRDKAKLGAQIANHLSGVIDRTILKGNNLTDARSSHLHLYAPERRPIAAFDVKRITAVPKDNVDEGFAQDNVQSNENGEATA